MDRMAAAASTGHCPAISAQSDEDPAGLGITQGIAFPVRDCERLITSSNTHSDIITLTVIASQRVNPGMPEVHAECIRVVAPVESELVTDNPVTPREGETGPSNGREWCSSFISPNQAVADMYQRVYIWRETSYWSSSDWVWNSIFKTRQWLGSNQFAWTCDWHWGCCPCQTSTRRVPLAFASEDKAALEKLQEQGTIHPSCFPWAVPLVLARKKCGSVRTCVDYRRLNLLRRKDAWSIPCTQDCLDALKGSILFSTLDITSAYNQIPVREEDIPKTAFVTRYGLYEFTTMPFGLTGASATFQRLMEIGLSGLQWSACLIYLDDAIIFSQTFDKHLERIWLVLDRIAEAGLKLKPRKCHLFAKETSRLAGPKNSYRG